MKTYIKKKNHKRTYTYIKTNRTSYFFCLYENAQESWSKMPIFPIQIIINFFSYLLLQLKIQSQQL